MTREEILQIAKPILFNTQMVWAILDNRKKATRRIAKGIIPFDDKGVYFNVFRRGEWSGPMTKEQVIEEYAPCKVGDYLYVRETWCNINKPGIEPDYYYFADTRICEDYMPSEWTWRPSIHMPKQAARIFLRVTDVRFERLQDINGHGVLAEGVDNGKSNPAMESRWENMQRMAFSELWNSTIPKKNLKKYGWNANPWVWVIEFERIMV